MAPVVAPGPAGFATDLSLLGSYINIPVAYLPERQTAGAAEISYFGVTYVIPGVRDFAATVLAVNAGGALIPIALSLYLILKHRLFGLSVLGIAIVDRRTHSGARTDDRRCCPGTGGAASRAARLHQRQSRHADRRRLGGPIASVGGAGTFDGIFITGLLAVLYAGLAGEARAIDRPCAPSRKLHRWRRYLAIRRSMLNGPAPFAISNRKPPAIERFLKNMIIWIWSPKLLWKMTAVSRE